MARWKKLGRVFVAQGQRDWMRTHAAVPFADVLDDRTVRVYFSCRDSEGRSHVASVDFDPSEPGRVRNLSSDPLLGPGRLGAFDDSGAMACWITPKGGRRYLYYIGWNLGVTVPFRNAIGLAVENGDGSFHRLAEGPVLDRSAREPHFVASPCVLHEDGRWRMWYLACLKWELEEGRPKHWYHVRHADSVDGVEWSNRGRVCIDFQSADEYAISRPCVVRDGGAYRMWYSHRGASYRIGYAISADGLHWQRRDEEAGIDVAPEGWDSEMIEYAHIFDQRGSRYMVYNGNGYGKTGFGLAVLEGA
jgi:hypothetical protein